MRRRLLPAVVLCAFAGSLVGACAAPTPVRLPTVALGSVLVWRAEAAAALFAASDAAIVALRLALHGETLTRVGRDGIEVPRVGAGSTVRALDDDAEVLSQEMQRLVARFQRPAPSDDPTHRLLRHDEEDA